MTYWKPPGIYSGDSIVSSQVFPLWFQFFGKEPQPTRIVNFQKTTRSQLNKELEDDTLETRNPENQKLRLQFKDDQKSLNKLL